MGELVRLVIDTIAYIWPFRIVKQWERGGYMVVGKWHHEVGPGLYLVVPFFTDVHAVPVTGSRVGTGRQDLTLFDGSTLSFTATVWAEISDVRAAICDVTNYDDTAQEDLTAVLSNELAELDPDRLRPRRRGALFKELEKKIAEAHAEYGVKSSDLSFGSFVLGLKVHRHLIDQTSPAKW